jgi:threonine/homoserine/homoserine lactone efflux protein
MIRPSASKEDVLAVVILILVIGSVILAVIDQSTRPAFADLVKVTLGAYIGLLVPNKKSRER